MCDEGMLSYRRITEGRLTSARLDGAETSTDEALQAAISTLKNVEGKHLAVLFGAEFSQEDNAALLWLAKRFGAEAFFETGKPDGAADNVLKLADKNPNSTGVRQLLGKSPSPEDQLTDGLRSGLFTHVLALGTTLKDSTQEPWFSSLRKHFVVLGTHGGALANTAHVFLPVAWAAESTGTFVNASGLAQASAQAVRPVVGVIPAHQAILKIAEGLGLGSPWKTLAELRAFIPGPSSPSSLETNSKVSVSTGAVAP
jgi:NADH dehydrogenase/NADH:ubiquinone oxidoreductase subunit G